MSTMVLSPLAVGGILIYQRFISPYKGFRCAHRAASQGWSCSEFGRRVFARYDLATAYALLQRRFAACKQSYATLGAGRFTTAMGPVLPVPQSEDERTRKQHKSNTDFGNCNGCDVPSADVCAIADIGVCDCSI